MVAAMRYFVTGATGFIGGRVARQLRAAGHQVIALARVPEKAKGLVDLGVEVHQGDITDRESMRPAMAGVDGVFHIAAWYKVGVRDTSPAHAINIEGTRNVLSLMKELGVAKGVYTSTLAVFSDTRGQIVDERYRPAAARSASEYERTKSVAHFEIAERMIQAGLPLTIVLPGAVYGPGDQGPMHEAVVQYLQGKMPICPDGTAFCWAHVDDTARGHVLAMERGKPGESYIIAGPPATMREVFELSERLTGKKAPRFHPGPGTMRAMASFMDAVGRVVPLPETYAGESLRAVAGVTYLGSNDKARRELGFEPRPLEQGLRETLMYEMEHLGMKPPAR